MNTSKTDITIVLDRSGSMQSVAHDTIGGFNKFLEDQKAAPGEAAITVYQFDHEFLLVTQTPDVKKCDALTAKTYVPRGTTALLDALGRAITETGQRLGLMLENDRPGKVVFVVMTDGQENASQEFDRTKVFAMIKEQTDKYSWEFVFLGANQDSIAAATGLGMNAANAMTYAHNAVGTQSAFRAISKNLRSFRAGTKATMCYEPEDIKAQADAGAKQ